LNPDNCATATISITVEAAEIVATDDTVIDINGYDGEDDVVNVFDNDTLNGDPVDPSEVTLSVGGTEVITPVSFLDADNNPTTQVVLNADGSVDVLAGTPAGTYTLEYSICEVLNPDNCATATISITVEAAEIVATDDDFGPINGLDGTENAGNVLTNDTLNGDPVSIDDVTLTIVTAATPINGGPVPSIDPSTGIVSIPENTPAGTYTIT
ncbi:hypothetical protein MM213_20755, partial [Belliella sp. R4-6]